LFLSQTDVDVGMQCLSGWVWNGAGLSRGYVLTEGGKVAEIGEGKPPMEPSAEGVILPELTDGHTHCADAGAAPLVRPGMSIEELVAPPDGLKHRYLREASDETLKRDMAAFDASAYSNGIGHFIDFREGGVKGARLAKEACPHAVVMGRPISPEFDPNEVSELLRIADGIAVSSISDMDTEYIARLADSCHKAGKPFALHVSERVREDIETALSFEPSFVVHMCEATDRDLKLTADAGVPVVSCPRSNRFFGKTAPLKRMLDAGCTVALGTDNAMLCSPDLRPEAALACDLLKAQKGDGNAVWGMLAAGKLLNRARTLTKLETGDRTAVLPCPDGGPEGALSCRTQVLLR
jgi:cytosine/adenosine deaminase-related metal-dependent hydrolase